jgi:hypothetical protein
MDKIDSFKNEYKFLSNFSIAEVEFEGITYPSVEHAYQAAKTLDKGERSNIRELSPGQAKKMGRKFKLRNDWEQVKIPIMYILLKDKFKGTLAQQLIETGNAELIEGNNWGDQFWGVCNGVGQNFLGRLLMRVRAEL